MGELTAGLPALFSLERKMEEVLRVAIAGASGIGKHHAKWFHQAGTQVVGVPARPVKNKKAQKKGK